MHFGHARIGNAGAHASAADARSAARRAETQIERLQFEVERLLLISEALWSIVREQHGFEDAELVRRVSEIDLRDGKLDGQLAPQPARPCTSCQRTLVKKRPYCLYCGAPALNDPFER